MKKLILTLLAAASISSASAQSITTSGGVRLEEFDCASYGILWYNRWNDVVVKIANYDHRVEYYSGNHEVSKYTVEDSKSYFIIEKNQLSWACVFRVVYYNEYGQWEWEEVFIDDEYEGCVRGGRNYNY